VQVVKAEAELLDHAVQRCENPVADVVFPQMFPEVFQMPLHYDFTITPVTCGSSGPCDVDVSWSLLLKVSGAAVGGGEFAAPLAFGSGRATLPCRTLSIR
jgi:hypothetical protein